MGKELTLTIDNQTITAPEGTLIVEAARQAGIIIPVFCYHPKLKPAGMCRVCLVEIGRPEINRQTRQPVLNEDGTPKIRFGPKLETACTMPVSEGMVVLTESEPAQKARRDTLEFILTNHPLDCPVCDKGGECPLQNLTMAFGSSESRYLFDDKQHLAKHVALGELIFLDRERCIQCGRCIRFQTEIAGDPVIGFYNRGRNTDVVTYSEPGFDSIWSGNTTDICPVGALTSADFRFGARPWEMSAQASLCNHCPVGCNLTYNVRREARSHGRNVIKRAMPRQNEWVNELWICDKGRFGYHYTESQDRLMKPLVRKDGELVPATWDEALDLVAEKFKAAGDGLAALVGGRLPNEDLFNLKQLTEARKGRALLHTYMAGGERTYAVGIGSAGINFADMGAETAIVVVTSDLHQEAPLWWLRIKAAVERGATLVVINPRPTRLDKYASHVVRYNYGDPIEPLLSALIPSFEDMPPEQRVMVERALECMPKPPERTPQSLQDAAAAVREAENLVIFYGSDGVGLAESDALSAACNNLLLIFGKEGRPNSGLIGVWHSGNIQGAWDMGFSPAEDLAGVLGGAQAVYVAAADPAGDDPVLAEALKTASFLVVQELFLTETAKLADVVLPAAAVTERQGTFTSGERRLQRFYPAVTPHPGPRADFAIAAQVAQRLDIQLEGRSAAAVMQQIAECKPAYKGLTYQKLAEAVEQWPAVGRQDLYYGGTAYDNQQGVGVQLPSGSELSNTLEYSVPVEMPDALVVPEGALRVVPVTRLYDRGQTMQGADLLDQRSAEPALWVHPQVAAGYDLQDGSVARVLLNDIEYMLKIYLDEALPQDTVLLPRSVGIPVSGPLVGKVIGVVEEDQTPEVSQMTEV